MPFERPTGGLAEDRAEVRRTVADPTGHDVERDVWIHVVVVDVLSGLVNHSG